MPGGLMAAERNSGDAATGLIGDLGEARSFYRWSLRLTAQLANARGQHGGDLDQFLIVSLFAEAEMAREIARAERRAAGRPCGELQPSGLNAMTVSQLCAIPRESARRKLGALAERGVVIQATDRLHYLTDRRYVRQFAAAVRPLAVTRGKG